MSVLLTYDEVEQVSVSGQLAVDPVTLDQLLVSGGVVASTDVRIYVNTTVPQVFTFDFTVRFDKLPTDFTNLVNSHIFLGVTDAAGPCVGLFFSKVGIAYAGAIHHDVVGNMVLDSVLQPLANSQLLVSESDYWSVRIAASFTTGGVYIYVTKTAELPAIGHQLRYVLPMIPAPALAQTPPDRTTISVRGTAAKGSQLALDTMCLASGFVVPNLPPIADAGLDQAVRMCSIVQLDGSRSADPEGAALTYRWRLLDAPLFSRFIFDGLDGATFPLPQPTGFTNKFYAPSLQELEATTGVIVGDVLVVAGAPYTIVNKGVDQNGFFVTVDGFVLPDGLVKAAFKYLYQNGISAPSTVKPTFYPDAPGIYKFDLVVFDGGLSSAPGVVIINVAESPIPRGCLPDVRFLWSYLSNFWGLGDLREERERITTFWGAMAQIAASELLTLWQVDYNKSLRDVQRTFQRRWLHYDPPLREMQPSVTKLRALHRGCRTAVFSAIGTADFSGTVVTLSSPALSAPASFTVPPGLLSPPLLAGLLQNGLKDKRIAVRVVVNNAGTEAYLRLDAPFAFTIEQSGASLFLETENTHPGGTAGVALGVRTYKTDWSLLELGIQEGDLLTIDGMGYRILRIASDASDAWPYQRVTLKEDLPVVTGSVWNVPSVITSTTLDFFAGLVSEGDVATMAVLGGEDEVLIDLLVYGASAGAPAALPVGAVAISHFLLDDRYEVQFLHARRYSYLPLDPLVMDIPYLQDRVRVLDDKTVLRRNIDFFIEPYRGYNAIRFDPGVWDAPPPDLIWAETTYLDNRPDIEANFGIPAAFTLDDLSQLPLNVDYLSAVRGLWYSYFNGPTLFNLRAGSQILLGLPFAEETGTIEEIRTDFSTTQGRILVRDQDREEIVRSYTFPASLRMEQNPATKSPYKVGDVVQQFAPLVTGVEILDWIKDPRWFEGYMNQGFFYEIEKFHKFLVRVDSAAFNLAALLFVKSFILRIKPTYTYPLFVVLQKISDTEVSVTDEVLATGTLLLYDGACFPTGTIATMFDDPKSPGGGWWSQFDADADPSTPPPVFPDPQPVAWGYDKHYLCPEDYVLGSACVTFAVATIPSFDSIFAWDTEVSTQLIALFQDSSVTAVLHPGGLTLYQPTTCLVNGTITDVQITIVGDPGLDDPNYYFILTKNDVDQAPIAFTQTAVGSFEHHATVSIPVAIGDILIGRVQSASASDTHPFWKSILVEVGASVSWSYDTPLPAGTYCAYKVL